MVRSAVLVLVLTCPAAAQPDRPERVELVPAALEALRATCLLETPLVRGLPASSPHGERLAVELTEPAGVVYQLRDTTTGKLRQTLPLVTPDEAARCDPTRPHLLPPLDERFAELAAELAGYRPLQPMRIRDAEGLRAVYLEGLDARHRHGLAAVAALGRDGWLTVTVYRHLPGFFALPTAYTPAERQVECGPAIHAPILRAVHLDSDRGLVVVEVTFEGTACHTPAPTWLAKRLTTYADDYHAWQAEKARARATVDPGATAVSPRGPDAGIEELSTRTE